MNILQVHNRALKPGGVDVIVETERSFLRSAGHVVEQLFLENSEVLGQSNLRAGLKGVWNVDFAHKLDTKIREFEPDIVHFQTPFPLMSPAAFRMASKHSVPTLASVHSYRYSCVQGLFLRDGKVCELCLGKKVKLSGIRHRCYHDSLLGSTALTASLAIHRGLGTFRDDVDTWIVNSSFVKRKLGDEGIRPDKIVIKPNAISDPGYHPEGRSGALFLGRLEPEKGIQALLDGWESLSDPPTLTILGDGSMRGLVERAAQSNEHIEFGGWVDQDEVRNSLAKAHFLILPSEWYEGQPIVAIQSLAAGTPIIASDVGNFSELIIPHVNGYHFRSGSADSLASVVKTAWMHLDSYSELSRGARTTFEQHHTESRNGEILLSAYDQAIRQREAH